MRAFFSCRTFRSGASLGSDGFFARKCHQKFGWKKWREMAAGWSSAGGALARCARATRHVPRRGALPWRALCPRARGRSRFSDRTARAEAGAGRPPGACARGAAMAAKAATFEELTAQYFSFVVVFEDANPALEALVAARLGHATIEHALRDPSRRGAAAAVLAAVHLPLLKAVLPQNRARRLPEPPIVPSGLGASAADTLADWGELVGAFESFCDVSFVAELAWACAEYWGHYSAGDCPLAPEERGVDAAWEAYAALPADSRADVLSALCHFVLHTGGDVADEIANWAKHHAAYERGELPRGQRPPPELRDEPVYVDASGREYFYEASPLGVRLYGVSPCRWQARRMRDDLVPPPLGGELEVLATGVEETAEFARRLKRCDGELADILQEALEDHENDEKRRRRDARRREARTHEQLALVIASETGRSRRARKIVSYTTDAYDALFEDAEEGGGKRSRRVGARADTADEARHMLPTEALRCGLRRGRSAKGIDVPSADAENGSHEPTSDGNDAGDGSDDGEATTEVSESEGEGARTTSDDERGRKRSRDAQIQEETNTSQSESEDMEGGEIEVRNPVPRWCRKSPLARHRHRLLQSARFTLTQRHAGDARQ